MTAPADLTIDRAGLSRRTVLLGGLALSPVLLLGMPDVTASAAERYPIVGSIRTTYARLGGATVFGAPLAAEVKRVIDGHRTYSQRFRNGIVWWGSHVGLGDVTAGRRVHLSTAENFRPAVGVRSVWRSDELDGATALEKRVVSDLGIATVIAMDSGSDPKIPGVTNLSCHVLNDGSHKDFYRSYVRDADNRKALGKVFTAVSRSTAPVLVHCRGGKDRTGWVCDVLAALANVSLGQRDASYLASGKKEYGDRDVDLDWLGYARTDVADRYSSLDSYLVVGCGVSTADLKRLKDRVR